MKHRLPAYTGGTLIDRLSTIRADWSLAGKGQSGRTGIEQGAADVAAIAPTQPLISMVRVTDATGAPADGSLPTSWVQSTGPSVNFKLGIEGSRIATPGAADVVPSDSTNTANTGRNNTVSRRLRHHDY